MALNPQNQIAVTGTVAEALKLTRALFLPYVILAVLFSLPIVGAGGLGLFDSLDDFTKQAQDRAAGESLGPFPFGGVLLGLGLGFAALSGFGIFWYRYLLLGPRNALKFGFAELNSMIWRFSGYGLLVIGGGMVVFTVATMLGCLFGAFAGRMLGQDGTSLAYAIQFAFVVLAYAWPLSFAARTALIFPAMAVGRPIALSEAWAASKHTSGSLVWALLIAGVPLVLLSWGAHFGLATALGVDPLTRSSLSADGYWWMDLLLSPVSNLGMAAMLGVVAIAYRDLMSRAQMPETAAGAQPAE